MSKKTVETAKYPLWKRIPYRWAHIVAVVAIYAFCTVVYGEVFVRAQQNCYVASSPELMTYVKNLPFGDVYCAARYLMLPFKNLWLGGAWLTMWLVGSACLLARGLIYCAQHTQGEAHVWKTLFISFTAASCSCSRLT